jgi:hypothetical protein
MKPRHGNVVSAALERNVSVANLGIRGIVETASLGQFEERRAGFLGRVLCRGTGRRGFVESQRGFVASRRGFVESRRGFVESQRGFVESRRDFQQRGRRNFRHGCRYGGGNGRTKPAKQTANSARAKLCKKWARNMHRMDHRPIRCRKLRQLPRGMHYAKDVEKFRKGFP